MTGKSAAAAHAAAVAEQHGRRDIKHGDLSLDKLEDRFASGSREEAAAPPQQQQHPPAATPQPAASGPMLTDTQAARVPTYGGPPLPTDPAAPVEPEGGHHAAGPPAGQLQQSISSVVDQVALGDMGAGPDFTRLKEGVRAEVAQVEDAVGRAAHTVEDAVGHAVDAAKHALRPGHAHTEQPGHLPPAPGTEPKGNGGQPSKL